jgi:predicted transcriptional regulator
MALSNQIQLLAVNSLLFVIPRRQRFKIEYSLADAIAKIDEMPFLKSIPQHQINTLTRLLDVASAKWHIELLYNEGLIVNEGNDYYSLTDEGVKAKDIGDYEQYISQLKKTKELESLTKELTVAALISTRRVNKTQTVGLTLTIAIILATCIFQFGTYWVAKEELELHRKQDTARKPPLVIEYKQLIESPADTSAIPSKSRVAKEAKK